MTSIRLWDLPLRVFHWLLVVVVAGSLISVKVGGDWMVWHERFGLAAVGLLSFRLIWGVLGSTYARFSVFLPSPAAVKLYIQGKWQGMGHNPLGALSVLAMIGLFGFQAVTGLFSNDEISFNGPLYPLVSSDLSNMLSGWHRQSEYFLYGLIALHVGAILFYTFVRKDNLIKPMVTGNKPIEDRRFSSAEGGGIGAFMTALFVSIVLVWLASGELIPPPPAPEPAPQDLGW
ncbi:cytochrome b/b6 domain-containing protein [Marinobacter sp. F3R08]|uniref:cytochrome b/b6 domain-containing protein n=1 Tax=Marinobacter sp. F3R08 TaxID=2841559 RepID=UPI001C097144|nr:cytochrome b/b6 domain-containing protein [Marinobacter sp. F3R08]MBU2955985.1 cytochrome b/b6 domain-containing protein [Marinobacter sp. F3R08]